MSTGSMHLTVSNSILAFSLNGLSLFTCCPQNQDTVGLDTVCRLYEVGRHKLAEEGDDDDQVRHTKQLVVLSM